MPLLSSYGGTRISEDTEEIQPLHSGSATAKFQLIVIKIKLTFCSGSLVPLCSRDDPNIDDCIVKAVNQLNPSLKKGKIQYF